MLPDHVLFDKAVDAVHKENPNLSLVDLETRARDRMAAFKVNALPPAPAATATAGVKP